ncbi:MAG: ImmA/IrrE family metallo-endopeptidase [Armatimonadetes bacterium]|nr:ImmA/IrrE family metallo-endopeptidase [Armatimonadota bacterium]
MQSIGERLKQARLAAGLSQAELAELAQPLSKMAISKYENDQMAPGSEVLSRLAKALGVKVGYFHRPITVRLECAEYRKHSRVAQQAQHAITGQIAETLERYLAVEEVFGPKHFPAFARPRACREALLALEDAEERAAGLRAEWDLGDDPIGNLCETLEDQGVKVILLGEAPKGFDAYSCWANGAMPVVVSTAASLPGDRQRFSLAHELGHLLLHFSNGLDVERACHRFAAAFLVPREAVYREVGRRRGQVSIEELHSLKHKWGMSMAAWTFRLRDLRVISDEQYRSLQVRFRVNGWHVTEPGRPVEPESTERLERLVQRAIAEDIISVSRAADFLNRPLIEVRRAMDRALEVTPA